MLLLLASLLLLFFLILVARLPAYLALLLTALATGLAAGLAPAAVLQSVQAGIGGTLGGVLFVLALGLMFGDMLAATGAMDAVAARLLRAWGERGIHFALALTAFLIGSVLFYNAGFVVLAPLVFSLAAAARRPLVPLALAMAAPLSVTHGFLPPHPGATAVALALGADLGRTLLLGLIAAVPAVVAGAIVFPWLIGRLNIEALPLPGLYDRPAGEDTRRRPGFGVSMALALLPIALMAASAIAELSLPPDSPTRSALKFAGEPTIALLIAVFATLFLLSQNFLNRKNELPTATALLSGSTSSLGAALVLLLIIAAGGAFKQVLIDTKLAAMLAERLSTIPASPLLLSWLLATALRVAVGSATVAGMTAAGLVQPLLVQTGASPELMTLAIGAGSLMCSHVNDSGFWMFREWFGLSVRDTFRTWTVMETLVGTVGLLMVLLLNVLVH
jgi:gluconate transporter